MTGGALLALGLGFFGLGCGQADQGEAPAAQKPAPSARPKPASVDASAQAKQIFATRCFTCHGTEGAGDGPGSKGLTPAPRNLQEAAWQDSVSDDHIEKIIMYGGMAVAKSPAMPPNPDLSSKPEVVSALVVHVRSLRAD